MLNSVIDFSGDLGDALGDALPDGVAISADTTCGGWGRPFVCRIHTPPVGDDAGCEQGAEFGSVRAYSRGGVGRGARR